MTECDPNQRQVGGNHYAGTYQHWDFVPTLNLSWQEGCATKYLDRIFKKHSEDPHLVVVDMEKVVHYLEKKISLLQKGVLTPYPGSQAYQEFHIQEYRRWIKFRNFGVDNPRLIDETVAVLMILSVWSWPEKSGFHTPITALTEAIFRVRALIGLYKTYAGITDDVVTGSTDPTKQSMSAPEATAYQAQSLDPVSPPEAEPKAKPEVQTQTAAKAEAASEPAEMDLPTRLRKFHEYQFAVLLQTQPQPIPASISVPFLESLRRYNDLVRLPLGARLARPGTEGRLEMTAFSDYAEPLIKIAAGTTALEESLPNQQLSRSLVALTIILDGVSCLQNWLLRVTEGENPLLHGEDAFQFRFAIQKTSSAYYGNCLPRMKEKGYDPVAYALGRIPVPVASPEASPESQPDQDSAA